MMIFHNICDCDCGSSLLIPTHFIFDAGNISMLKTLPIVSKKNFLLTTDWVAREEFERENVQLENYPLDPRFLCRCPKRRWCSRKCRVTRMYSWCSNVNLNSSEKAFEQVRHTITNIYIGWYGTWALEQFVKCTKSTRHNFIYLCVSDREKNNHPIKVLKWFGHLGDLGLCVLNTKPYLTHCQRTSVHMR